MPRVFLSYAREDGEIAKKIFEDLDQKGIDVWFNVKHLRPGQRWKTEIVKAIRSSDYFLALLSRKSVSKRGFVQKELKEALEVVDELPESQIFVIPVRLDDCSPSHERLADLQWVDLFQSYQDGLERILVLFQFDLNQLMQPELPAWIHLAPPARNLPADVKAFCGRWSGRWDGILDHVLVVERVTRHRAELIYATGVARQWNFNRARWVRVRGSVKPRVLKAQLPRPAEVTYVLEEDSTLDALYEWSGGLSKAVMRRLR